MKKAIIKKLVIVDTKIEFLNEVLEALRLENKEYLKYSDGKVQFENTIIRKDLSGLSWVQYNYGSGYYGVNTKWIADEIKNKKYDSVAYVIHNDNWNKKENNRQVYGWSLGLIENKLATLNRAIKGSRIYSKLFSPPVLSLFITFYEEDMHGWDNIIEDKLNINLDKLYGFNYDESIVHGFRNGYTRWKYGKTIKKLTPYLLEIYGKEIMEWIIINNRDQYILIPEIKLAISISKPEVIESLKRKGLQGSPIDKDKSYIEDYIELTGATKAEIKDLFNI